MNHLYNMFLKQVQDYCGSLTMPDCKKVLLVYGLKNLAKMEDDSLDKMDPYQRGATEIIWESMMEGVFKAPGSTTQKEDLYETNTSIFDSSSTVGNTLGSQEEASSHVQHYIPGDHKKYVIGPMVVRLLPNGNPVPGEAGIPMLKDEDAEEYKLMHAPSTPSIQELVDSISNLQPSAQMPLMDNTHNHGSSHGHVTNA